MGPAERKYVLDTNLFIRGFREPAAKVELLKFHSLFAPFEYLSVIVAQELKAGLPAKAARKALERNVLDLFARRNRLVVPSARAWEESGDVLAELSRTESLETARITKSFGNDVLLALSCREAGMVLITENTRDFARIAKITPFQFIGPWPEPVG